MFFMYFAFHSLELSKFVWEEGGETIGVIFGKMNGFI